ncbi:MAG: pyrroline-5-carboxylate reductase [Alphaproteobacteria bacterium]|nr:pyrroline-5-carboxylate reductase [Alphaproteobacteria bacterium]
MSFDFNLVLVGCGKMGQALLHGWVQQKTIDVSKIIVIDPHCNDLALWSNQGIKIFSHSDAIPNNFRPSLIVLAIKPQHFENVLISYKRFVDKDTAFLSIAAGITFKFMERILGTPVSLIRAMPNIAVLVQSSITVLCSNKWVNKQHQEISDKILKVVGDVIWIENETLFDPITALSGSGPAYIFFLAECMIKAAIKGGLPFDLAENLVRKTLIGSAFLSKELVLETFANLRTKVTSPGGTTEAALNYLIHESNFEEIIEKAIDQAVKRAFDLSK